MELGIRRVTLPVGIRPTSLFEYAPQLAEHRILRLWQQFRANYEEFVLTISGRNACIQTAHME